MMCNSFKSIEIGLPILICIPSECREFKWRITCFLVKNIKSAYRDTRTMCRLFVITVRVIKFCCNWGWYSRYSFIWLACRSTPLNLLSLTCISFTHLFLAGFLYGSLKHATHSFCHFVQDTVYNFAEVFFIGKNCFVLGVYWPFSLCLRSDWAM